MLKIIWCLTLSIILQIIIHKCGALDVEPKVVHSNFIKSLLRKVLQDIDETQNFVIAPMEMQNLCENSPQSAETDNGTAAPPAAAASSLPHDVPIEVSRRLEHANETELHVVSLHTRWVHNFQRRDSRKHYFHAMPKKLIYTDVMSKDDYFPYAHLPTLNATALKLSLEENQIRMLVLLPNENDGMRHMAHALAGQMDLLEELMRAGGAGMKSTLVRVIVPKFQIIHRVALDEFFSDDVCKVAPDQINYMETEIEVNEHGIGNLRHATVLFWNIFSSLRITPKLFDMNHPFLFLIYDSRGLQFVGHLANF